MFYDSFLCINFVNILFDKLISGPFGTMEPPKTQTSILPQILVVPMLSFDKELYRLGYGGGYYDKSINILKKHFKKETVTSPE